MSGDRSYPVLRLSIWLCLYYSALCSAYKPIIVIHGILDNPSSFDLMVQFITESHPGTSVNIIDLYDDLESLSPLWQQVSNFTIKVREITKKAKDGVHMIGFSQGGILARGILSMMPDHNVQTFIALSTPQMGQYGDTSYLKWLFPETIKEELYKICYKEFGQNISFCNYWNDPHHHDLYLKQNVYLPVINNEVTSSHSDEIKKNFLKIKNLVLIGGPDDGVITPWQSSQYGFYDSNEKVQDMTDQKVYQQDSFGLRTLDKRGAIKMYTVAGVEHTNWHKNETVFKDCVLPWLT
ncbi:lysosomal thioesterase PPT2-A-like [Glandiceps talaboti]